MPKTPAHRREELGEHGPALMALSPRRREFVIQYIMCGCGAQAARKAGYGTPTSKPLTFAKQAWFLLHDAQVLAALREESVKHYHSLSAKAVREVERILDSPTSRDSDKLRAADGILARADPVITNQIVQVSHDHHIRMSSDEVTARILELAGRVGVEVAALPPVIDAVAEEVPA
jgi:hypothetical protein